MVAEVRALNDQGITLPRTAPGQQQAAPVIQPAQPQPLQSQPLQSQPIIIDPQ
jgi:hypothetical protein